MAEMEEHRCDAGIGATRGDTCGCTSRHGLVEMHTGTAMASGACSMDPG